MFYVALMLVFERSVQQLLSDSVNVNVNVGYDL